MANADRRRIADEVTAGDSQIIAYVPTAADKKQVALAQATALGFSLPQIRAFRAFYFLFNGTPAQKLAAKAILDPLIQLIADAQAVSDSIDAGGSPAPLIPPLIPTVNP